MNAVHRLVWLLFHCCNLVFHQNIRCMAGDARLWIDGPSTSCCLMSNPESINWQVCVEERLRPISAETPATLKILLNPDCFQEALGGGRLRPISAKEAMRENFQTSKLVQPTFVPGDLSNGRIV